jgi:hypothetical protein
MQKIIKEYFEIFPYILTLKNQEEMDKFLNKYDPPKLNHENINKSNRYIMSNETKIVINNQKRIKSQDEWIHC